MFDKISVSQQVKRFVIISNRHSTYELSHQFLKDLRVTNLGNHKVSKRSKNFMNCSLVLSLSPKIKILSIIPKNSSKIKLNCSRSVLFHKKTTVCPRYFGHNFLRKLYFASNSPPGPFKFDLINNFGNSKVFNTVLA